MAIPAAILAGRSPRDRSGPASSVLALFLGLGDTSRLAFTARFLFHLRHTEQHAGNQLPYRAVRTRLNDKPVIAAPHALVWLRGFTGPPGA